VKLGKTPVTPSLQPDANDQYRFNDPAVGGAFVSYALNFKLGSSGTPPVPGGPPVFNSFVGPTGVAVPGFNGASKSRRTAFLTDSRSATTR